MNKPDWWPECPYPKDLFPMELNDITDVVPDEATRTALSGAMGRLFWELASDAIYRAMIEEQKEESQ